MVEIIQPNIQVKTDTTLEHQYCFKNKGAVTYANRNLCTLLNTYQSCYIMNHNKVYMVYVAWQYHISLFFFLSLYFSFILLPLFIFHIQILFHSHQLLLTLRLLNCQNRFNVNKKVILVSKEISIEVCLGHFLKQRLQSYRQILAPHSEY